MSDLKTFADSRRALESGGVGLSWFWLCTCIPSALIPLLYFLHGRGMSLPKWCPEKMLEAVLAELIFEDIWQTLLGINRVFYYDLPRDKLDTALAFSSVFAILGIGEAGLVIASHARQNWSSRAREAAIEDGAYFLMP